MKKFPTALSQRFASPRNEPSDVADDSWAPLTQFKPSFECQVHYKVSLNHKAIHVKLLVTISTLAWSLERCDREQDTTPLTMAGKVDGLSSLLPPSSRVNQASVSTSVSALSSTEQVSPVEETGMTGWRRRLASILAVRL